MRWIPVGLFWVALLGIAYTYVGYLIIITLLARLWPRPVRSAPISPSVTVLIAAYNEQDCIAEKIDGTLALDYPPDKLEIVVAADGSNDDTCDIVERYTDRGVRLLHQPERRGKVGALLRAVPLTTGDIVVFSDANTVYPEDTLRVLVRHFADPGVGGASGSKRMLDEAGSAAGQGEGLYWRYESHLKRCDSAVSSVMGVPGEIWAARRTAYVPPDPDSLLDDFVASMRMVASGWRVVYDPEATAYEAASPSLGAEWSRRARNAAGGWQAFFKLPEMLRHPLRLITFQYVSHRMLRWMVTPFLFPLLLVASICLARSPAYAAIALAQTLFYALASLGWLAAKLGWPTRWLTLPLYVCLLNSASMVGGWRYVRGGQSVLWQKVR